MEPTTSASSLTSGPYRTRRRVGSRFCTGCRQGRERPNAPGRSQRVSVPYGADRADQIMSGLSVLNGEPSKAPITVVLSKPAR